MRKGKKLTAKQIDAARLALSHAEADAEGGGGWDDERSKELRRGCQVLESLLRAAITLAEGGANEDSRPR